MRKSLVHLLLLGMLGLGTTSAEKQQSTREPTGSPLPKKERRDFFQRMLQRLDQNGDQAIDLDEFSSGKRMEQLPEDHRKRLFRRLDKNQDGRITKEEMPAMSGMKRRHRERDLDGDGKVSFQEFQSSPRISNLPLERQHAIFDRIDINQDGVLDEADEKGRKSHRRRPGREKASSRGWDKLDQDNDGVLTFEEFRQHPRLKGATEDEQEDRFETLDLNRNGTLEKSEIPKRFRGKKPQKKTLDPVSHEGPTAPPAP